MYKNDHLLGRAISELKGNSSGVAIGKRTEKTNLELKQDIRLLKANTCIPIIYSEL